MTPGALIRCLHGDRNIHPGDTFTVAGREQLRPDGPELLRLEGVERLYGTWRFVPAAEYVEPWKPPREPDPTPEEQAAFDAALARETKRAKTEKTKGSKHAN